MDVQSMAILNEKDKKSPWHVSANSFIVICLLVFCIFYYLLAIISQRNMVFDDSFISYRYAKNLANGYGLTWNPNEAPVEGYTNFLLVIILAPFIKLGADPLLVTRLLSSVSAFFLCLILYRITRNEYGAAKNSALLIVVAFLLLTNTDFLIVLGLETVLYTAFLFLAFAFAVQYLHTQSRNNGYLFSYISFLTFLLRPEVVFLVAAFLIISGILFWKEKRGFKPLFFFWLPVGVALGLPFFAYLLWKYFYFGAILPNPFYIKASANQLFSPLGIDSITEFLKSYSLLIALSVLSFFIPSDKNQPERWFAALFCLFCILFYMRVDTLMDKGGRFLYPLAIFLVYLSIPFLSRAFNYLLSHAQKWDWKSPVFVAAFILLFNPQSISQATADLNTIIHNGKERTISPLMQKEYKVAIALGKYPEIKQIRIAFGDAGVIPYFSEALSLDDVGLNDRFIAKETDLNKLTNYYFDQKPDLAMLASIPDTAWINNGHGHLGNFAKWSKDKRWDNYAYTGTIKTNGAYDIELFVRKDLVTFEEFKSYLQKHVIDGAYDRFPLPIGSYQPDKNIPSAWIPLADGN
jgi:arabinofuranosyltransferase